MTAPLASLPTKGLCAHRGAFETAPENTLPGISEAIRLGVEMIEFDLQLTKDGALVLMHDATIDRTTNGTGTVADQTLADLRKLDAGLWKGAEFKGTSIPTFEEVVELIPRSVWINCELKGGADLAKAAAAALLRMGRDDQTFFAARPDAIEAIRCVSADLMVCNMDRAESVESYVEKTVAMGANFIQFKNGRYPTQKMIEHLHNHGVWTNYFYARTDEELFALVDCGVDFVLVNNVAAFQRALASRVVGQQ